MTAAGDTIRYAPGAPGYWMYETSGVLAPAVRAYLSGAELTEPQITAMRAYLRQWIAAPAWCGRQVGVLRARIDGLTTRQAIEAWLSLAVEDGIDPL